MLRSKYARPDTPTFVELTFRSGNQEYRVRRNPEYQRPKARGEGFTAEKAGAELHLPDGKVIAKLTDVNRAIVDILGMDRGQFTQIAMIAQGDFLKLLLSPTEERRKIFQKLFHTRPYQRLQDRLKEEAGRLRAELEAAAASIRQYISGIQCPPDSPQALQLGQIQEGQLPLSETPALLTGCSRRTPGPGTSAWVRIQETDRALEGLNARLVQAQEQERTQQALQRAQSQLTLCLPQLEQAREALAAEQAKQGRPRSSPRLPPPSRPSCPSTPGWTSCAAPTAACSPRWRPSGSSWNSTAGSSTPSRPAWTSWARARRP